MSDDKNDNTSPFAGALADKLEDLDIEPAERESEDAAGAADTSQASQTDTSTRHGEWSSPDVHTPSAPRATRPNDHPRPSQADQSEAPLDETLTDEELFERAVHDLSREDIYEGKFKGEGPDVPADQSAETAPDAQPTDAAADTDSADSDRAREEVAELRQWRTFEQAVGPVDQTVDRGKYRQPEPRDPAKDAARRTASGDSSGEGMSTPALPKSGDGLHNVAPLAASQRDLLKRHQKRSRRREVEELNVRGDTTEDALRQLELFVHQQCKESARFVRIIHGRGLRSDGAPVLKPAVLRWLEGPGLRYVRGYAPEINSAGDYGSIIVELEAKKEGKA